MLVPPNTVMDMNNVMMLQQNQINKETRKL